MRPDSARCRVVRQSIFHLPPCYAHSAGGHYNINLMHGACQRHLIPEIHHCQIDHSPQHYVAVESYFWPVRKNLPKIRSRKPSCKVRGSLWELDCYRFRLDAHSSVIQRLKCPKTRSGAVNAQSTFITNSEYDSLMEFEHRVQKWTSTTRYWASWPDRLKGLDLPPVRSPSRTSVGLPEHLILRNPNNFNVWHSILVMF